MKIHKVKSNDSLLVEYMILLSNPHRVRILELCYKPTTYKVLVNNIALSRPTILRYVTDLEFMGMISVDKTEQPFKIKSIIEKLEISFIPFSIPKMDERMV